MKFVTFIVLLLIPSIAYADPPNTIEALASSIFRVKSGERGDIRWSECGGYIRGEETRVRSLEYATLLIEQHQRDVDFDPWIAAAIAYQESSFDRCAISSQAWRSFRVQFEETYGRSPGEEDISRLLARPAYRRRLGVPVFDAGLFQFRWPGSAARSVGVRDASTLIDAETSVRIMAASLRHYRGLCTEDATFDGARTFTRQGITHVEYYSIPCEEAYWVVHNTGGRFNYRYYRNVNRRYTELVSYVPQDTTQNDS